MQIRYIKMNYVNNILQIKGQHNCPKIQTLLDQQQ